MIATSVASRSDGYDTMLPPLAMARGVTRAESFSSEAISQYDIRASEIGGHLPMHAILGRDNDKYSLPNSLELKLHNKASDYYPISFWTLNESA